MPQSCFNIKQTGIALSVTVYYIVHIMTFGNHIKTKRLELSRGNRDFSLRKVALAINVEPSFLSKVERDLVAPPSEAKIRRLAEVLGEDADILLAMAGKVSTDLQEIILKRPKLFADMLRHLKKEPDHAVLRIVREIKDGNW